MRGQNWLIGIVLTLLVVVISLPLFRPDFLYLHDFVHAARVGEVWRGWSAGHWPVRWSEYFGFGYGMPLFEFYAPLPYYVGAIWFGLGLDVVTSVKIIFLLASVIAISGAYFAGKSLGDKWSGLLTAGLFVLAPYRAVNLYVRGALSESWAMAFFPWITFGLVLVIKRHRWGWVVLTFSLVGLMLSHNLSSLLFLPLSVLFGGVLLLGFQQLRTKRVWLELAGAYVLSGLLSAFYIFPAFLEKNLTQLSLILGGYFDYRLHFVYIRQLITPYWGYGGSGWGPDDGLSFFLGWGFLLGVGITLATLVVRWLLKSHRGNHTGWLTITALVLGGCCAVMTLGKTAWLWEHVPLLSFVQFPWRWLAASSWWLALAIGSASSFISERYKVCLIVVLLSVGVLTQARYFEPEKMVHPADALYYTDPSRIVTHMSDILMDYVPMTFDYKWATQHPQLPGKIVVAPAELQDTPLEVDKPHYRRIAFDVSEPTKLELGIAAFPNWQVLVNGQVTEASMSARGLLVAQVPAGRSVVEATWQPTLLRLVSDVVSGTAWFGILAYLLWRILSSRRQDEKIGG